MVPEIYLGRRNCEIHNRFKPLVWRRNVWKSAKRGTVVARDLRQMEIIKTYTAPDSQENSRDL